MRFADGEWYSAAIFLEVWDCSAVWYLQGDNRKPKACKGKSIAAHTGKRITHSEVLISRGAHITEGAHQLCHRISGLLTGHKVSGEENREERKSGCARNAARWGAQSRCAHAMKEGFTGKRRRCARAVAARTSKTETVHLGHRRILSLQIIEHLEMRSA